MTDCDSCGHDYVEASRKTRRTTNTRIVREERGAPFGSWEHRLNGYYFDGTEDPIEREITSVEEWDEVKYRCSRCGDTTEREENHRSYEE